MYYAGKQRCLVFVGNLISRLWKTGRGLGTRLICSSRNWIVYFNCISTFQSAKLLSRVWLVQTLEIHLWESRVEIESYSVMYFDRIAPSEAPYRWTSGKGRAHMHFIEHYIFMHLQSMYEPGNSVIWSFKHSNMIQIRDGITFDFYTGLPHVHLKCLWVYP